MSRPRFTHPRYCVLGTLFLASVCFCSGDARAQTFGPPGLLSDTVVPSDLGDDIDPRVAGDGAGNWVAVWGSQDALGGTIGTDDDILVSRSADDGATWTDPAPLNSRAAIDTLQDYAPQVVTDGGGAWVVVWYSYDDLGGTIGTDMDILVSRSTDDGATWTPQAALNATAAIDSGHDYHPHLATNGAGDWITVWNSSENLGGTIGTDDDILLSRSTDDGASWSAPAVLDPRATTDGSYDQRPRVATDGAGNWVAAWHSGDSIGGTIGTDNDVLYSRSTDGGTTWSSSVPLNTNAGTDTGHDLFPEVVTDGSGTWIAVWYSSDTLGGTVGGDEDVFYARSTDDGASWMPPATLNSNAATDVGSDYVPTLTTDGAGNWVSVWATDDSLGGTVGNDFDRVFSRSTDGGVTWSALAPLNSNASADSGDDFYGYVTNDGSGGWLSVWQSGENLGGTIGTDADILVSFSSDAGNSWGAAEVLNTNADTESGHEDRPRLATDGAGNWIAVWYANDDLGGTIGTDSDILYSRSTDDGATWTAASALNTNAASDSLSDTYPTVATDGGGTWIAIWTSNENLGGTIGTDSDVFVSRSTDAGMTWTVPATLNTNAASDTGSEYDPSLATDGAGNWVAVWRSHDSLSGTIGTDADILLSRSTDNGMTWTAPAAVHSNAASDTGFDAAPQITTDSMGTWVVAWWSTENLAGAIGTDRDILFVRSTDDGASWTAPAVLNSNSAGWTGQNLNPDLATDGSGVWVALWYSSDDLSGTIGSDNDILFARSLDGGTTWSAVSTLNTNAAGDAGGDYFPRLSTDTAGKWVAVWRSDDDLGSTVGNDGDILFSSSIDDGVTWSAPSALNTNAGTDAGADSNPDLATDGAGHWIAAWSSEDSLGGQASHGTYDIFYAVAGVCGDAVVAGIEDCDDGGLVDGDCCSSSCEFEAASSPCPADGIACTDDVCDGAGTCGVPDHGVCDDSYVCTVDVCDPVLDCQNLQEPTDVSQCLVALKTKFQIKDSDKVGKDKLQWQWKKGEAFDQLDVGTPEVATSYTLCVYDQSASVSNLALSLEVPASPTLWDDKDPKGAKYKDKAATSDGVFKVQLKTGDDTKTKAQLKAKGLNLVLPGPVGATYFEQDPSVVAQLFNSEGACWTTEFEPADNKKHDEEQFKALTK